MANYTLELMRDIGVNLTVKNFVDLNWFGGKKLKELEGEELIEVEEFREAVADLKRRRRQ